MTKDDLVFRVSMWAEQERRYLKQVCWSRWHIGLAFLTYQRTGSMRDGTINEVAIATGHSPPLLSQCFAFARMCPTRDAAKEAIDHMGSWSQIASILPQDPDQILYYVERTAHMSENLKVPDERKEEIGGALLAAGRSMMETAASLQWRENEDHP